MNVSLIVSHIEVAVSVNHVGLYEEHAMRQGIPQRHWPVFVVVAVDPRRLLDGADFLEALRSRVRDKSAEADVAGARRR